MWRRCASAAFGPARCPCRWRACWRRSRPPPETSTCSSSGGKRTAIRLALLVLPDVGDEDGRQLRLDSIELRDGAIYLAGETLPAKPIELARRERPSADPAPAEDPAAADESPVVEAVEGETAAHEPLAAEPTEGEVMEPESFAPSPGDDEPAGEPEMPVASEPSTDGEDQPAADAAASEKVQR